MLASKGMKKKNVNIQTNEVDMHAFKTAKTDNCREHILDNVQGIISPSEYMETSYHLKKKSDGLKITSNLTSVHKSNRIIGDEGERNGHAVHVNHNVYNQKKDINIIKTGNIKNEKYLDIKNYKWGINSNNAKEICQHSCTTNVLINDKKELSNVESIHMNDMVNDFLHFNNDNREYTILRKSKVRSKYDNSLSDKVISKNEISLTASGREIPPAYNISKNEKTYNNVISENHSNNMNIHEMKGLVQEIELKRWEEYICIYLYGSNKAELGKFKIELDILEQNCKLFKGLNIKSQLIDYPCSNVNRKICRNADEHPNNKIEPTTFIIKKEDIIENYCNHLSLNEKRKYIYQIISISLSAENFMILFTLLKMKNKMNILFVEINKITAEIKSLIKVIDKKLEELANLIPHLELIRNIKKETKTIVIKNWMDFFLCITSVYSNICTLVKAQNSIFSFFKLNDEMISSYLFFVKKFSNYISFNVLEIQKFYVQIKNMQNEETQNYLNRDEKNILANIYNNLVNHLNTDYKKIFIFRKILDIYLIELKNFKNYQRDYTINKINILISSKCPYDLLIFSVLVKSKCMCEISVRNICNNFDLTNFQKNKKIYSLFLNKKIKNNILRKIKKYIGGNTYTTLKNIFFYNELNSLMKNALHNIHFREDQHTEQCEGVLEDDYWDENFVHSPRDMDKNVHNFFHMTELCSPCDTKKENLKKRSKLRGEEEEEEEEGGDDGGDKEIKRAESKNSIKENYKVMVERNDTILSNATTNNMSTCSSLNNGEDSKYLQNIDKMLKTKNALTIVRNIRKSLDISNFSTSNSCLEEEKKDSCYRKFIQGKKSKNSFSCAVQEHLNRKVHHKNEENCIKLKCENKKKVLANEIDRLKKVFKSYEREGKREKKEEEGEEKGENKAKGGEEKKQGKKKKIGNNNVGRHSGQNGQLSLLRNQPTDAYCDRGVEKEQFRSFIQNSENENAAKKTLSKKRNKIQNDKSLNSKHISDSMLFETKNPEQSYNMKQNIRRDKNENKKIKIRENIKNIKEIEKNYKELQEIQRKEKFKKQLKELKLKKITKRNNINLLKIRGIKNIKKKLFTSFVKKDINALDTIIKFKINGKQEFNTSDKGTSKKERNSPISNAKQRDIPSNQTKYNSTQESLSYLTRDGENKDIKYILNNLNLISRKKSKSNSVFRSENEEENNQGIHQKESVYEHFTYDNLNKFNDEKFKKNDLNSSYKNRNNEYLNYENMEMAVTKRANKTDRAVKAVNDKIFIKCKKQRNLKEANTDCEDNNIPYNEKNKKYGNHGTKDNLDYSLSDKEMCEQSPPETHFFVAIEDYNDHTDMIFSPRQNENTTDRSNLESSNQNIKYKFSDYTKKCKKEEKSDIFIQNNSIQEKFQNRNEGTCCENAESRSYIIDDLDCPSEVMMIEKNHSQMQQQGDTNIHEMTDEKSFKLFKKKERMVGPITNEKYVQTEYYTFPKIQVKYKVNTKMISGRKIKEKTNDYFSIWGTYKTRESIERRRRIDNYAKTLRTLGSLRNIEISLKRIKNVESKVKRKYIIELLKRRQHERILTNHLIYRDGYVFLKKNPPSKF